MSQGALKHGERAAREASERFAGSFATTTALQALPVANRVDGAMAVVMDGYSLWVFDAASSASASAIVLVPAAGSGRWHACTLASL